MTDRLSTAKLIVGYFPGWAIHAQNYHVSNIPADKLTHINYAFAGVSASGECASIRPQDDQINLPALQLLKQQYQGLQTIISIGGAAHSNNFSKAVGSAAARQYLAQSCVNFMKASGCDGIDIDWEFPGPTDKSNYTELLKELRSQLNTQGATDGVQYLLTAALPAKPEHYANLALDQIHQHVDWINLAAYNFYTATSSKTHFSSSLYSALSDPESDPKKHSLYNVDAAVQAYLSAGVPPAKLVVGVPFFGHGWAGVPNVNHGLYQPATGPAYGTWANDGVFDYKDLTNNYLQTYLRFWSAETSVPWLYSPDTGVMISYDDAQSVGLKADYVNANNLAGTMIWPLSADDAQSSLVDALATRLNLSQPAGLNPLPSPPAAPTILENATRRISKATYVPLIISLDSPLFNFPEGRAIVKFGYVRQLALQPGEVDAIWGALSASGSQGSSALAPVGDGPVANTLRLFEGAPMPSLLPAPSAFAELPSSVLLQFGKGLVAHRQQALHQLKQKTSGAPLPFTSSAIATAIEPHTTRSLTRLPEAGAAASAPASFDLSTTAGKALNLINVAIGATNSFEANVTATPIGMLNLERLEMTPAGITRGELLATIPLAPREQTAVVQKEWSVTTKEFTSIVTDSLENYSETGVTENTDLSQSTTSQTQHSNQFNINATVSGGYAFVTGSVSSGFRSQDSNSQSATDSRKHAIETTRRASARVKQEHKVTISATTVTGTSETTTRILQNPSDTEPMRIDYFSLMRQWRVALYRYGLRLTYDIALPEPGGALREIYMRLADLQSQAAQGFAGFFPARYGDITRANWTILASQYQASLPEPPADTMEVSFISPYTAQDQSHITFFTLELDLPDGYVVSTATLTANQAPNVSGDPSDPTWYPVLQVMHVGQLPTPPTPTWQDNTTSLDFLSGLSGKQYVVYGVISSPSGVVEVDVQLQLTADGFAAWQAQAWTALYNAAQTQYYNQQQSLNASIQALQDQINNVDTLTLRREENDEIMKGVLRWLLGPSFDFMPPGVVSLFGSVVNGTTTYDRLSHGVSFTGNDLFSADPALYPSDWSTMFQYQEMVKFINEAIEWENVLYFLYSYFWDVPASWDFIRQIRHPDAIRQALLRAGSARVVLTVRKGWETAWVSFVETGGFGQTLLPSHPYMTIAQEIQAYERYELSGDSSRQSRFRLDLRTS
jgi:GH18 family chitinase